VQKADALDPTRPVASLLSLAGLTQQELAKAMRVGQPAIANALARERRGALVGLEWLLRAIKAADRDLVIYCTPTGDHVQVPCKRRENAQRLAHRRVKKALVEGALTRPGACEVCGSCVRRVEAHHDDYAKPLDVRWLCEKHHRQWHLANGPGENR
jgi:transcriptional regulator with XRE-family HTH domain